MGMKIKSILIIDVSKTRFPGYEAWDQPKSISTKSKRSLKAIWYVPQLKRDVTCQQTRHGS